MYHGIGTHLDDPQCGLPRGTAAHGRDEDVGNE